jgi:hypothetical protein
LQPLPFLIAHRIHVRRQVSGHEFTRAVRALRIWALAPASLFSTGLHIFRSASSVRISGKPFSPVSSTRLSVSVVKIWLFPNPRSSALIRGRAFADHPITRDLPITRSFYPCHPDRPRTTLSLRRGASGSGRTPRMIRITMPHQGVLSTNRLDRRLGPQSSPLLA